MRKQFILSLSLVSACGGASARDGGRSAARDSARVVIAAPQHVDSALPRDEELRRFRRGLDPVPTTLRGGEQSADALIRRFVRALERRDSAAFAPMLMTRGEFAYFYYPSAPLSKPPYDLSPALMWMQIEGNNAKGLAHLLAERAGQPLHLISWTCAPSVQQDQNVVRDRCVVRRVQATGDTVAESLFGSIIERDGRVKFLSYANKL